MIRPIPLRRYLEIMGQRGFAASEVLAGTGLTLFQIEDPEALVDEASYLRVIDRMVTLAGDDGLGFDVGLAREASDFRILGHAALVCSTVRQSMNDYWFRYGDSLGVMAKISLRNETSATCVGDIIATRSSERAYRFLVEETLAILLKVGGQVQGQAPRFERLQLAFPRPSYADRYAELFGCPVRFDAGKSQVSLGRDWLDSPLRTNDPELLKLFQVNLEKTQRDLETGEVISHQLKRLFARTGASLALDQAASALGLSPRTLRRRLQEEGCSYRVILETYRIESAVQAVQSGARSAREISASVGFDDVNAFRRAFKRWTGHTVKEFTEKEGAA